MQLDESPCYAIVPAAGSSRRMGQPKLLLRWPTAERPDGTVMDQVLEAWTSSRVCEVVVVVRADDDQLATVCRRWPVTLLQPDTPPADMKASVQFGVEYLRDHVAVSTDCHCFVAPADLPHLNFPIIDRLVAARHNSDSIIVPQFGNRRGHPVLLPWSRLQDVFTLHKDEGVDALVERHPKELVVFNADERVTDIDTPDEYDKAMQTRR